MHAAKKETSPAKGEMGGDTEEPLKLLLFLLPAYLALDAVEEDLQRLRYQHHTGGMLRFKQPEHGLWSQRAGIHDAGARMKQRHFNGQFKHVTQRKHREGTVFRLDIDQCNSCSRITR